MRNKLRGINYHLTSPLKDPAAITAGLNGWQLTHMRQLGSQKRSEAQGNGATRLMAYLAERDTLIPVHGAHDNMAYRLLRSLLCNHARNGILPLAWTTESPPQHQAVALPSNSCPCQHLIPLLLPAVVQDDIGRVVALVGKAPAKDVPGSQSPRGVAPTGDVVPVPSIKHPDTPPS